MVLCNLRQTTYGTAVTGCVQLAARYSRRTWWPDPGKGMARNTKQAKTAEVVKAGNGYADSRFNATKHGILSRYTVLPWEDREEYENLHQALIEERSPVGPTEEHLVEELTGIFWRKRRIRLAEAASYTTGLAHAVLRPLVHDETSPHPLVERATIAHGEHPAKLTPAVITDITGVFADTEKETKGQLWAFRAAKTQIEEALEILQQGGPKAYEKAKKTLAPATRKRWLEDVTTFKRDLEKDPAVSSLGIVWEETAENLEKYLTKLVTHLYGWIVTELSYREAIKTQAYGESLDVSRLSTLARYETQLDRKMERTLTMLFRLQQIRGDSEPD